MRRHHELLKPRWLIGHLLAITAISSFVLLGMWQLRRHDEKSALRERITAAQQNEPTRIEDIGDGDYLPVVATGEYDPEVEATVLRSQDGSSGYQVLTPLRLSDGTAVIVNRGWVPLDVDYPGLGEAPIGLVTVVGMLWPAEEGSSIPVDLEPDEDGLPRVVRRIDPEIQQAFVEYPLRGEYLVLVNASPPPTIALPSAPEIPLGPHLGYALQWFAFTVVVLFGYPLLLRRARRASPTLADHDSNGDDGNADGLDDARGLAEEPPGE